MKVGNSNEQVIYKEVVIIGNGPSGLALSYMLSGNLPHVTSDGHPDEMLSMRLQPHVGQCLVKQDLGLLSAGLEGRSTNPVSLLLDSLLHPCADIGLEMEPLCEFRKVGSEIDHIVLGKGPPGGSWHKMDPYMLTLSLDTWMSLPGLPFHSRDSGEKRAFACNVADYYVQYVREMGLERYFVNNANVTAVRRLEEPHRSSRRISCSSSTLSEVERQQVEEPATVANNSDIDEVDLSSTRSRKPCRLSNALSYLLARHRKCKQNYYSRCGKRPRDGLCLGQSPDRKMRELSNRSGEESAVGNYNHRQQQVPFRIQRYNNLLVPDERSNFLVEVTNSESGETTSYSCKYLILATGTSDIPNRLNFATSRPDPDWLLHDLRTLETRLDAFASSREHLDPVLIVGAGLSAADAVIAVRARNVPVVHVFRNKSADLNRQLPENMYPEYHKVHQMMQDGGSLYPFYTAQPEHSVVDIDPKSRSVLLVSKSGDSQKVRVSFMAVLIGARPDLGFLPADIANDLRQKTIMKGTNNTLTIDKMSHAVDGVDNLFALGPLSGDNFVRFIPGGALAVINELYKRDDLCCSCSTHSM